MKDITEPDLTDEDRTFDYQPELTFWLDAHSGEYDDLIICKITP